MMQVTDAEFSKPVPLLMTSYPVLTFMKHMPVDADN